MKINIFSIFSILLILFISKNIRCSSSKYISSNGSKTSYCLKYEPCTFDRAFEVITEDESVFYLFNGNYDLTNSPLKLITTSIRFTSFSSQNDSNIVLKFSQKNTEELFFIGFIEYSDIQLTFENMEITALQRPLFNFFKQTQFFHTNIKFINVIISNFQESIFQERSKISTKRLTFEKCKIINNEKLGNLYILSLDQQTSMIEIIKTEFLNNKSPIYLQNDYNHDVTNSKLSIQIVDSKFDSNEELSFYIQKNDIDAKYCNIQDFSLKNVKVLNNKKGFLFSNTTTENDFLQLSITYSAFLSNEANIFQINSMTNVIAHLNEFSDNQNIDKEPIFYIDNNENNKLEFFSNKFSCNKNKLIHGENVHNFEFSNNILKDNNEWSTLHFINFKNFKNNVFENNKNFLFYNTLENTNNIFKNNENFIFIKNDFIKLIDCQFLDNHNILFSTKDFELSNSTINFTNINTTINNNKNLKIENECFKLSDDNSNLKILKKSKIINCKLSYLNSKHNNYNVVIDDSRFINFNNYFSQCRLNLDINSGNFIGYGLNIGNFKNFRMLNSNISKSQNRGIEIFFSNCCENFLIDNSKIHKNFKLNKNNNDDDEEEEDVYSIGGGILMNGKLYSNSKYSITNSTSIYENKANYGGGIFYNFTRIGNISKDNFKFYASIENNEAFKEGGGIYLNYKNISKYSKEFLEFFNNENIVDNYAVNGENFQTVPFQFQLLYGNNYICSEKEKNILFCVINQIRIMDFYKSLITVPLLNDFQIDFKIDFLEKNISDLVTIENKILEKSSFKNLWKFSFYLNFKNESKYYPLPLYKSVRFSMIFKNEKYIDIDQEYINLDFDTKELHNIIFYLLIVLGVILAISCVICIICILPMIIICKKRGFKGLNIFKRRDGYYRI